VRKLRGAQVPEARVVIVTAPGQEAQVDYGTGPMVRDPETRKYRRTRLFVMTLGAVASRFVYSPSAPAPHLGGTTRASVSPIRRATRIVVLDICARACSSRPLRSRSESLYRDVLAHYGAGGHALPHQDPDRKGKVESGVGHAQRTPLKGLRFESLQEAQAYLDCWKNAGRTRASTAPPSGRSRYVCRREIGVASTSAGAFPLLPVTAKKPVKVETHVNSWPTTRK